MFVEPFAACFSFISKGVICLTAESNHSITEILYLEQSRRCVVENDPFFATRERIPGFTASSGRDKLLVTSVTSFVQEPPGIFLIEFVKKVRFNRLLERVSGQHHVSDSQS
ncbi:hypothetical protein RRG08_065875 [Elysia crispata]|uniref:Uncharacterized protein n=1 Tax=Elysia crispata TaxID=231223 RepID=A0AAE1AA80_9GAST|nr:hypothetical protein RRG08_065875 [Elysia crispata]